MSWLKNIHLGVYQRTWMLPLAIGLYACTPFLFLYGLNFATLTVLNLTWDMFSDVLAFGALYLFTTGAPSQ